MVLSQPEGKKEGCRVEETRQTRGPLAKALRNLAQRLRAEGRLNLEEAFIDAMFVAAKKGASGLVLPSEAKGRRSRLSPLATVYLSPSVSRLLRPTKANWTLTAIGTLSRSE